MTLTSKDIVALLGPTDETLIADILSIRATTDELAEACAWISSDEALIGQGRPLPSGKIAELVEVLSVGEDELEGEGPGGDGAVPGPLRLLPY